MTINITFYTKPDCPACEAAEQALSALQSQVPHRVVKIDVMADPVMAEKFERIAPVVEVGPYRLKTQFTAQELQIALQAASQRADQLEQIEGKSYQDRKTRGETFGSADRMSDWISRHYVALICAFLLIYAGLPFVAPVLMKAGATLPATIIYKVYSPMCHQLAFRSYFLFGEQAFYPRAMAGMDGVITYETLSGRDPVDIMEARNFVGNETVGYKIALCERDVAIWGSMLAFGILFALTGRRLKPIPWWAWVIFGLGPIGLDGVSQLPGLTQGLPAWVLMRESTPFLRSLTGVMFGVATGWYLFPMIEETARETRRMMQRKQAVAAQVIAKPEQR